METTSHATVTAVPSTTPYQDVEATMPPWPSWVGRYEIQGIIDSGAMGVVYRAIDPDLGREVAVKLVRGQRRDPTGDARLLREAQAMARLRHPNVVPILDVGQDDGAVFVVMPLIAGGTLRRWLDHNHPFDAMLDIFVAAGRGLVAAHGAGIVHRDFKPENVLLDGDGNVYVADFGIARIVDPAERPPPQEIRVNAYAATETGGLVGTPPYMAPEQLRGLPIDARADQFSFCVALWEGAFGERPFPDPPKSVDHMEKFRIDAITTGPTRPLRRDRPGWLAPLLMRGMAADPQQRWPSLQALLAVIATHRAPRRWPKHIAAGALLVGAAVAIAAWRARPEDSPAPVPAPAPLHCDCLTMSLSPRGDRLVMVVGDALKLRLPDGSAPTLIPQGVSADGRIGWSPDGRRLVVRFEKAIGRVDEKVVALDDDTQFTLPVSGMASFVSDHEVAVASYRDRQVTVLEAAEHGAVQAVCKVPGEYDEIESVTGMPDGTITIETLNRSSQRHALVILDRRCTLRAVVSPAGLRSVATSDSGTLVALVTGDGFDEIVELSPYGVERSRRRINARLDGGEVREILGRRNGTDYVSTRRLRSYLGRGRDEAVWQRMLSIQGVASFAFAPDAREVAWVEHTGCQRGPGPLRISDLLGRQPWAPALRSDALMAGWSPDGQKLAVLIARPEPETGTALIVIDRTGRELARTPLEHLDRNAAPVWLDDHRIAAQTAERTTYRWFDLRTGEQGRLTDVDHGSMYWLARSPVDGRLAMFRIGPPGKIDEHTPHLWIQRPGEAPRPVPVAAEAATHYLLPSWSPDGRLLVRALDTGVVSWVDPDTGVFTKLAQLPPTPKIGTFDDHVLAMADGELFAFELEAAYNVFALR